tara:strand:+ start:416 stop:628 length:213 start_codon:yes stop_codon:yes gene_type:complete
MKKLYRNINNSKIAGVCQGLAFHFNADVALVRAAFLIFGFTGWGILFYIALWIVTPKFKTKTKKTNAKNI